MDDKKLTNIEDTCSYAMDVFLNGEEKKGIKLSNGDIQVGKDIYDKEEVNTYSFGDNDRVSIYGSPKKDKDQYKTGW